MQFYNCKVRLDGQIHNEVRKQEVTAAEIICLQHIHGVDAVVEIEPTKSRDAEHASIRDRLEREYGPGLLRLELSVFKLFGPPHQPLPLKLPNAVSEDKPAPRRRKAKKAAEEGSAADLFAA